jgi:sugar phosphate isomerase/epimerase
MQDVLKHLQVHIPFDQLLQKHLDKVLREGINPEIAFNCAILDRFTDGEYAGLAQRICGPHRSITFHGPFMDLRPGAVDPEIRHVSFRRFLRVFEIAVHFRPRAIVFHPSYDERYYVSSGRKWLENSIGTWSKLLPLADQLDTRIALENVYETDPDWIGRLLDAFPPERVGFCFDTGHFNAFARTPLETWMDRLGHRLVEVHLHDNRGALDEHLPVGEGTFPFGEFFSILAGKGLRPILTVEAHTEQNLSKTLFNIERAGILEGFRRGGSGFPPVPGPAAGRS